MYHITQIEITTTRIIVYRMYSVHTYRWTVRRETSLRGMSITI